MKKQIERGTEKNTRSRIKRINNISLLGRLQCERPFATAVRRTHRLYGMVYQGRQALWISERRYANVEAAVGMWTYAGGQSSEGGCDPGAARRILRIVGGGENEAFAFIAGRRKEAALTL